MDLEWTAGEAVSYDAEQALPGRYLALLRSESVPDKVLLVGQFEMDELAREAAGMAMLVANSESESEWIALAGVVHAEE